MAFLLLHNYTDFIEYWPMDTVFRIRLLLEKLPIYTLSFSLKHGHL